MKYSSLPKSKILKVILLGDLAVGKTSLMRSLANRQFIGQYKSTLGADFIMHELNIDGRLVTLQIWDTAGQERFSRLASTYYRGADCCIFVYDVTSSDSFKNLEAWMDDFLIYTNPSAGTKFPCLVLGNKIDLTEERVIKTQRADKWCQQNGDLPHLEVSAKDYPNVSLAFKTLAKIVLEREDPLSTLLVSVKLADDTQEVNKSKCC